MYNPHKEHPWRTQLKWPGKLHHSAYRTSTTEDHSAKTRRSTWKQTPGVSRNEKTKKHGPNERMRQTTRKIIGRNGGKHSTRYKTLVIRILSKLRGEMDTLSENLKNGKHKKGEREH